MVHTAVAVVSSPGNSVQVHSPELLGKDIFCPGVVTVGFPEPGLVLVWGVASDWLGGDGTIIIWVSWVSHAVVTTNRAALRPPETRLA